MSSTTNASKPTKPLYFKGINTLRFIAAFCILIPHSIIYLPLQYPPLVKMFIHNLSIGVDLFFMISGFLIIYILLTEKQRTQSISLRKYYIRRVLRIFPLYYLIIFLSMWFYDDSYFHHHQYGYSFMYFWGNFKMIALGKWTVGGLNPLWTLCIEEHFYLVIPFLLLITPLKKIHILFWSVLVICFLYRAYIFQFENANWMKLHLHTISKCDLMAVGGLIAYYYHHNNNKILHFKSWHLLLAFIALCTSMTLLNFAEFLTFFGATLKKYVFIIPMTILFIGLILNKRQHVIYKIFNENIVFNYLGRISFGIYVYHSLIRDMLFEYSFYKELGWMQVIVLTAITIIVSTISYEFFEKRILRLKSKFVIVKATN